MDVRKTTQFAAWIDGLRDLHGRARILARIERLTEGVIEEKPTCCCVDSIEITGGHVLSKSGYFLDLTESEKKSLAEKKWDDCAGTTFTAMVSMDWKWGEGGDCTLEWFERDILDLIAKEASSGQWIDQHKKKVMSEKGPQGSATTEYWEYGMAKQWGLVPLTDSPCFPSTHQSAGAQGDATAPHRKRDLRGLIRVTSGCKDCKNQSVEASWAQLIEWSEGGHNGPYRAKLKKNWFYQNPPPKQKRGIGSPRDAEVGFEEYGHDQWVEDVKEDVKKHSNNIALK